MISYAREFLRWVIAHPWIMAWAAFAKGAILGTLITATVYRRRECKEGGGPAAAEPQVEQMETLVILGQTT